MFFQCYVIVCGPVAPRWIIPGLIWKKSIHGTLVEHTITAPWRNNYKAQRGNQWLSLTMKCHQMKVIAPRCISIYYRLCSFFYCTQYDEVQVDKYSYVIDWTCTAQSWRWWIMYLLCSLVFVLFIFSILQICHAHFTDLQPFVLKKMTTTKSRQTVRFVLLMQGT